MRRFVVAAALAGIALPAAACNSHNSSGVAAGPTLSAAAHSAEQKGLALIEGCTPNGKAMIGGVVNGTASGLTYVQVVKYATHGGIHNTWTCIAKRPGPVPVADAKRALEHCFETSPALTEAVQHPFKSAHHVKDTATALMNAAAVCAGNQTP